MKTIEQFDKWWLEVQRILKLQSGTSPDDMSDQPWRDWFDNNVSPNVAVQRALRNESY